MRNIDNFKALLRKAWCEATAWRQRWDPANPALNQCAVTVLLVRELFGGRILRGVAELPNGEFASHYWNQLGGVEYDFTREQFPEGTRITVLQVEQGDELYQYLRGSVDTWTRYGLLAQRFAAAIG
jgi:hypothetical protein